MRPVAPLLACAALFAQAPARHFVVRVVDEETQRGVPLIELHLPNAVRYVTDSAGIVAIEEPSLWNHKLFLAVQGHGYEYAEQSAFGRGAYVIPKPGGRIEIKVKRRMIAERLYRLTGEGIYRDSVLAGLPVPIKEPLLNGQVLGQDTVSAAVYQGKIFWIWGDTVGPAFFNFSVSGAVSDLPDKGGLDPAVGVNFRYFTGPDGAVKAMLPLPREGLVWIEGMFTVRDPKGEDRLLATFTRQQGLKPPDECGVALFDDAKQQFAPWAEMPCRGSHISSHPFRFREGGTEYWYLYPWLRVPNDWNALKDPERWESREFQAPADAKRPSSVTWNEFRKRWILLMEDVGDVWYSEAKHPEGPYGPSVRIVQHDKYNFYNVAQHAFFNQEKGRVIYFEGTYTDSFSDATEKTPRYNYNQVMYRLSVDDPRLKDAQQ